MSVNQHALWTVRIRLVTHLKKIVVSVHRQCTKREVLLRGVNLAALAPLASLFTFGAVDRPSGLGVQVCRCSCAGIDELRLGG